MTVDDLFGVLICGLIVLCILTVIAFGRTFERDDDDKKGPR